MVGKGINITLVSHTHSSACVVYLAYQAATMITVGTFLGLKLRNFLVIEFTPDEEPGAGYQTQ